MKDCSGDQSRNRMRGKDHMEGQERVGEVKDEDPLNHGAKRSPYKEGRERRRT